MGQPFTVKRGGISTQFTPEQWDMLGANKDGWVKEVEAPTEVKELQTEKENKERGHHLGLIGLPGILTDEEVAAVPREAWSHVMTALRNVSSRIDTLVSYKVNQLTGIRPGVADVTITPDTTEKVETPAVPQTINEAALTAVNNEPPVKAAPEEELPKRTDVLSDDLNRNLPPVDASTPAPVVTTVGPAATPAAPVEETPVKTVNKGGRPKKADANEDPAANHA